MHDFMKTNALHDLYAGCVMPWDREILSDMALPSDVVDPFASQDADPIAIMNLTFVSLKGWIEDARKAAYYSERFVDLSKLVMKGVTTMGRGLVTLHNRGEDLSAAPMQIEDLISVGSYHFRKSYLGVVQFSAKRPEIGERLLLNQLRWADMLLRLYKTKEKLSEKPAIRCHQPEINDGNNNETAQSKIGGQENTGDKLPAASPFASLDSLFVDRTSSLSSHPSLNEPAAFSAQRALSALDGSRQCGKRNSKTHGAAPEARGVSHPAAAKPAQGDCHPCCATPEPEIPDIPKTPETQIEEIISKSDNTDPEETPGDFHDQDRSSEIPDPVSKSEPIPEEQLHERDRPPEIPDPDSISDLLPEEQIHEPDPPPDDPLNNMPFDPDIPFYLEILRHAFGRSTLNEEGTVTFTEDEIICLARDPAFAQVYPDQAAQMRKILARLQGDG